MAGPADYDHIVIAIGADSSGLYYNDLYSRTPRYLALPGGAKSRGQCVTANPVQPYTYCLPRDVDYALAITGVVDPRKELLPVSLAVDR